MFNRVSEEAIVVVKVCHTEEMPYDSSKRQAAELMATLNALAQALAGASVHYQTKGKTKR